MSLPRSVLATTALRVLGGVTQDSGGSRTWGKAAPLGALAGLEWAEVLGCPPVYQPHEHAQWKGMAGSMGGPHSDSSAAPHPHPWGPRLRTTHTWSFSPTFTIIISPTISIQLVPQGL